MNKDEQWRHEWEELPAIGTKLILDGQEYSVLEIEDYTRKDGQPSKIIHYRSKCPVCGALFHVTSGRVARQFARRCPEHRDPLNRVTGQRGDRIRVEVA